MPSEPKAAMRLRLFFMAYWHEGEHEIDESSPQRVTLWEPLHTDAPQDARPFCYLGNNIDFWKPEDKWPDKKLGLTQEEMREAACYARGVEHYATSQGFGQPVLVYVQALDTWYELGLGEVVWRDDRWYFKHSGRKNTAAAHFANSGMPGYRHYQCWTPKSGTFVPYADKARRAIEAAERQPSRLTVGDIDKLMAGVRQTLAIETSATEQQHCGGLLVALEDLKQCVEATA